MLRITISKSGQPPTTTNFDKPEISIGRTASNDVRIPEPGVSSAHARILYTDGSLTVIDLSSTNGTFVNGTRIQGPHMVQPGDEVYICSHKLTFELDGAAASAGGYPPSLPSPPAGPGGYPPSLPSPPSGPGGYPPSLPSPPGGPDGYPPSLPSPPGGAPPLPSPPLGPPSMPGPAAGPPPPLPGISAPPPIPGPGGPKLDPSLPPPIGGALGLPQMAAPPVGGMPSGAGMPTLPPMMGDGAPAAAPPAAPEPPGLPSPAGPPPPIAVPEPPGPPPSMAPPEPPGPPPSMAPPEPPGPPPSMAPPEPPGPPPSMAPPEPPGPPPSMAPPEPPGPPPSMAPPEPPGPPPSMAPPEPPGPPPSMAPPEPPGPPPSMAPPEPPGPPPSMAPPEPPGPPLASPEPPGPPPSSTPPAPKPRAVTPSTSAPSAKGDIGPHTEAPDPSTPSSPKVVIGSKPPVRTGATMMADHVALSRDVPHPPLEAPTPSSAGAGSVDRHDAPSLRPQSIAGLPPEAQIAEACAQVFRVTHAAMSADQALGDDGIMAMLRNGLEDFKPYAQGLDPMALAAQMHAELTGPGAIAPLLGQASVEEILLLGPRQAMVRRTGQASTAESLAFSSAEALTWAVELLTGAPFGAHQPVVEATTHEGHRVHAIHHSLSAEGPIVRIRRGVAQATRHDLGQLVASGMLSDPAAKLLTAAVQGGLRIAIATAPGARSFPLVAALMHVAPPGQRHVVVRPTDAPAQLPAGTIHLQATRPSAMASLVDAALGMGPQRLVVHEIGGDEATSVLAALDRGLEGAVISVRGNDASEALHHLAALASQRDGQRMAARVARSVDVVVTLARFGDGLCRVTQIAQPFATAEGSVDATDLIAFDPHARNWTHTGALGGFASTLAARGIHLDLG